MPMSLNDEEQFVVGDLVVFTGYDLDRPPLAHKIGIVVGVNSPVAYASDIYEVLWLHSGARVTVSAKHLDLAYTKNKTDL
jgi:hypothetical protein